MTERSRLERLLNPLPVWLARVLLVPGFAYLGWLVFSLLFTPMSEPLPLPLWQFLLVDLAAAIVIFLACMRLHYHDKRRGGS